jgi:hypothetical protein
MKFEVHHILTPEDWRRMRVVRAALSIELRVRANARTLLPSAGAELDPAIPLLSEASRALMSSLPTASVVVCRGCLEAALHAALVRMNLGRRRFELKVPAGRPRRNQFPGLEFLLREAESGGLLGEGLCKSARLIKEDGDFGAHLAARRDTSFMSAAEPQRDPATGRATWKPVRLWVSEERALSNLRAMERILGVVTKRAGEVARLPPSGQLARLKGLPIVPRQEWSAPRKETRKNGES